MDISDNPCLFAPQGILRKASAWIEVALCVNRQHLASSAPVAVLQMAIQRLAHVFIEERTSIILVIASVYDGIGERGELFLKACVIAFFPYILKHAVDVHLVDAEVVKMKNALLDVRNVCAADGHFRSSTRELLQP